MAPKARFNKRGNTRMDAALDAMGQFGFQKQRVREAVRKLLRVYGGDDGWPFIEEDYYRVLLEALLEKDGSQDDARSLKDTETSTAGPSSGVTTRSYAKFQTLKTNLQIEAALNSIKDTEPSNAGSSSRVSAPDCSELETANTNLLTDTTVNSQSTKAMDFDPETNKEGAEDSDPPTKQGGEGNLADKKLNMNSTNLQIDADLNSIKDTEPSNVGSSSRVSARAKDSNPPTKQGGEGNLADENLKLNFTKNDVDSFLDSEIQTDKPQIVFAKDSGYDKNTSNYPIHSPNQECSLSLRKRRHYHGWVSASCEDHNDNDLVDLTPDPLPEGLANLSRKIHGKKQRKSLWDMKPEDMSQPLTNYLKA
ncbi:hypothetical protein F8388_016366 [Cannabis sativa]|uniref:WIYLD domain-containing protein n=1 Tax=Cannabis sativa TaxID=3483 RepID=A0A7J6HMM7_CANSA|nr:hypothetical protein F8388_016366 [Cannabis sativa]KAF4395710.1 hypothetical protein G4B88_013484 [Cannabis sativa]